MASDTVSKTDGAMNGATTDSLLAELREAQARIEELEGKLRLANLKLKGAEQKIESLRKDLHRES